MYKFIIVKWKQHGIARKSDIHEESSTYVCNAVDKDKKDRGYMR